MKQFLYNPIDHIAWLNPHDLVANDYNPNVVQPAELKLLKISIERNGWIQPILISQDRVVIDGFHRATLARMENWEVPCCVLDISEAERMLMTIRINRAKGTHIAFKMADIVKELVQKHELPKAYIAQSIGASLEEVELLMMQDVFQKMNIDKHQYSRAWTTKK